MRSPPQRSLRWLDVLILTATLVVAFAMVSWADAEYRRVEAPSMPRAIHAVSRPSWFWLLEGPYRRLKHDWFWLCVAYTLGIGAILVCRRETWTRRRLSRPGTIVVFVLILLRTVTAAHQAFLAPAFARPSGMCYSLTNVLNFRLHGAILGVWVVGWLRPSRSVPDWPERAGRIVGWMWLANVGLLIGCGVLFG